MKRTPLQRKTPLKAYKPLTAKTPLRAKTRLKAKQKTAKKLPAPYHSIFTQDMHTCYITGDTKNVEPHHIFQGESKKVFSEKYGFMLPLRSDWHRTEDYAIHKDKNFRISFRIRCQEYYVSVLGKTKEDWKREFGKWWSEEDMDAQWQQPEKG